MYIYVYAVYMYVYAVCVYVYTVYMYIPYICMHIYLSFHPFVYPPIPSIRLSIHPSSHIPVGVYISVVVEAQALSMRFSSNDSSNDRVSIRLSIHPSSHIPVGVYIGVCVCVHHFLYTFII